MHYKYYGLHYSIEWRKKYTTQRRGLAEREEKSYFILCVLCLVLSQSKGDSAWDNKIRRIAELRSDTRNKAEEVIDLSKYLCLKYEDELIKSGIMKLASESKSFEFLKDEEDLYSMKDVKVIY